MKRLVIATMLLLLLGGSTHAQQQQPKAQAARPFLWQVSGNGITTPSFLLGTVHEGLVPKKDLAPIVWQRFKTARSLVIEMNNHDVDQMAVQQLMFLPQGQTLDALIGPKAWAVLQGKVQIPAANLRRIKPWALVLEIQRSWVRKPGVPMMEEVFLKEAKQGGKQLGYLEKAIDALKLINSVEKEWALQLKEMMLEEAKAKKELALLMKAYKAGDEAAMAREVAKGLKQYPKTYEKVLFQRNKNWIPGIEKELKAGNAFIAVGCAHLVGKNSVVELLKAKGYTVERVALVEKK